jgi:biotin synthase
VLAAGARRTLHRHAQAALRTGGWSAQRALLDSSDDARRAPGGFRRASPAFWPVRLCVLNNARSGLCGEDCGYCSQSSVSTVSETLSACRSSAVDGARARHGRVRMVTSARPSGGDVRRFAEAARRIRAELPQLQLCVSLGVMGDAEAGALRAAGVDFVNHNLNTSRRFYSEICTTHTYDDRVATVRSAKRAGLSACSGVIVGMGETDDR